MKSQKDKIQKNQLSVKLNYHGEGRRKASELVGLVNDVNKSEFIWIEKLSGQLQNISLSLEDKNEGYCGAIESLEWKFIQCSNKNKKVIIQLANKPVNTAKGQSKKSSSNALSVCHSSTITGRVTCLCPPGYFKYGSGCSQCAEGTFKQEVGNQTCRTCGKNSNSYQNYTKCLCKETFFRELGHEQSFDDCFDTKPKNFKFFLTKKDNVHASWSASNRSLSIGNITYTIECTNCKKFEHFKISTTNNFIIIKGLQPNRFYAATLTARYRVNERHSLYKILHILPVSFFVSHAEPNGDRTFIVIISVMVPLVLTCAIVVMLLYANQRRKNVYFQRKLTSLKRKSRPPLPPAVSKYQANNTEVTNDSEECSTIKPYAVLNFKSDPKNRDTEKNPKCDEEKCSLLNNKKDNVNEGENYVSMQANKEPQAQKRTTKVYWICTLTKRLYHPPNQWFI